MSAISIESGSISNPNFTSKRPILIQGVRFCGLSQGSKGTNVRSCTPCINIPKATPNASSTTPGATQETMRFCVCSSLTTRPDKALNKNPISGSHTINQAFCMSKGSDSPNPRPPSQSQTVAQQFATLPCRSYTSLKEGERQTS